MRKIRCSSLLVLVSTCLAELWSRYKFEMLFLRSGSWCSNLCLWHNNLCRWQVWTSNSIFLEEKQPDFGNVTEQKKPILLQHIPVYCQRSSGCLQMMLWSRSVSKWVLALKFSLWGPYSLFYRFPRNMYPYLQNNCLSLREDLLF